MKKITLIILVASVTSCTAIRYKGAYQVYLNQDSIILKDGKKWIGSVPWNDSCKISRIILADNL